MHDPTPPPPPGWTFWRALGLVMACLAYAGFGAAALCGISGGVLFFPWLDAGTIFLLIGGGAVAFGITLGAHWLIGYIRRIVKF